MPKKILVVVTSFEKYPDLNRPTGLWLGEAVHFVNNKRVTGFSNAEETLAELDKHVPYLTETEMRERGAKYEKADEPWAAFAVEDDRVITGQNPASGGVVADMLLAALK